jgi:hypothetical protein
VSEETAKTVFEEWKGGVLGKEEKPHSSLHCLFVLFLVVHALLFPLPLLSVGGASLHMGNTMVVTHYSIMVCCLMDKRVDTTLKTILKREVTAVVVVFQFVILF